MQLQPRAHLPDPELWRAVHEAPATSAQRHVVANTAWPHPPHGMPADRLAMAASLQPCLAPQSERLR